MVLRILLCDLNVIICLFFINNNLFIVDKILGLWEIIIVVIFCLWIWCSVFIRVWLFLLFKFVLGLFNISRWILLNRVWVKVICWCCFVDRVMLLGLIFVLYFWGNFRISWWYFVFCVVVMILVLWMFMVIWVMFFFIVLLNNFIFCGR